MKFLIDAHLPAKLARQLEDAGHDCLHTSQLPHGNRTTDAEIGEVADREERVVVSKDRDFRDGHIVNGRPRRLLVIATGNITNAALLALMESYLDVLISAFAEADFVELGDRVIVVHPRREVT